MPVSNYPTCVTESRQRGSAMLLTIDQYSLQFHTSAVFRRPLAESTRQQRRQPIVEHFRWDHTNLDLYHENTRSLLQPIICTHRRNQAVKFIICCNRQPMVFAAEVDLDWHGLDNTSHQYTTNTINTTCDLPCKRPPLHRTCAL